jgi:hypothetical protein
VLGGEPVIRSLPFSVQQLVSNFRGIIESGNNAEMIKRENRLMNPLKDGTVEATDVYMKAAKKALFAPLLKPGDLIEGHCILAFTSSVPTPRPSPTRSSRHPPQSRPRAPTTRRPPFLPAPSRPIR